MVAMAGTSGKKIGIIWQSLSIPNGFLSTRKMIFTLAGCDPVAAHWLSIHLEGAQSRLPKRQLHSFQWSTGACRQQQTRATTISIIIERHALMGRGIGYVDAHLLAAVTLDGVTRIWTRDKHLRTVADVLALAYGKD